MPTLHIEHPITAPETWLAAYDPFADRRAGAGAPAERIWRPARARHRIVLDLDFDTADQASSFLHFLTTQVWATPDNAPALGGTPRTTMLDAVPHPAVR